MLPQTFDPQGYGIALPTGSPFFKAMDVALLEAISDPHWQEIQDHYFGKPGL